MKSLSHVQLFVTPWTIACQAPPSMGFSRQRYWNGLPFPSPGIFPTQGLNPGLPHCRQTLYHLSHQGSPNTIYIFHMCVRACACACLCYSLGHVQLFVTPWTIAWQASLSMEFSRQEYWSDCHALLQGSFLTHGSNPHFLCLLHWQMGSLPLATPGKPPINPAMCYIWKLWRK